MPSKKPSISDLQAHIVDLTAALQRERADAENIRRRHQEQMFGLRESVKADVVRELLPIVDNFERSLKHVPKNLANNDYVKGVQAVVKQFEKTLTDMGVERIPTVGEHFNPHLHEAVSAEGGSDVISEELQAGYKLGDSIIRHAMVKLGNPRV